MANETGATTDGAEVGVRSDDDALRRRAARPRPRVGAGPAALGVSEHLRRLGQQGEAVAAEEARRATARAGARRASSRSVASSRSPGGAQDPYETGLAPRRRRVGEIALVGPERDPSELAVHRDQARSDVPSEIRVAEPFGAPAERSRHCSSDSSYRPSRAAAPAWSMALQHEERRCPRRRRHSRILGQAAVELVSVGPDEGGAPSGWSSPAARSPRSPASSARRAASWSAGLLLIAGAARTTGSSTSGRAPGCGVIAHAGAPPPRPRRPARPTARRPCS